jgi:hypothetical protein
MIVEPGTQIKASDVEHGMVVDIAYGRDLAAERIAVYGISNGPNGEVELTDSRGTPTELRSTDLVTVRGYFNLD